MWFQNDDEMAEYHCAIGFRFHVCTLSWRFTLLVCVHIVCGVTLFYYFPVPVAGVLVLFFPSTFACLGGV